MTLRSRLPSPNRAKLSAEDQLLYDRRLERIASYGDLMQDDFAGYTGALMYLPEVLKAQLDHLDREFPLPKPDWRPSTIDYSETGHRGAYLRDLVRVVVGIELHSNLILNGHMCDAVVSGVRLEAIQALLDGQDHLLTHDEAVLVQFVRQVIHRRVTDASFEAVQSRLGPHGMSEFLWDITHIAAAIMFISALDLSEPSDNEIQQRLVDLEAALAAGQELDRFLTFRHGLHVTGRASTPA